MSKWIFRKTRPRPYYVCEDIGNILHFDFCPGGFNDNDGFIVKNEVRKYLVTGRLLFYARIYPRVLLHGFWEIDVTPIEEIFETIEDGAIIDEKSTLMAKSHCSIYCIDPRILALIDGTVDITIGHYPKGTHEKLYSRIPTRETAIRYLEKNGYSWGRLLTWSDVEQRLSAQEIDRILRTPGDVSILLEDT